MIIKQLTDNDLPFLSELQPHGWNDITGIYSYYIMNDFCLPVKVCVNDTPVGVGTAIFFAKTGWLAHIIVHHDYRNKGIGKLLVNHLTTHLKKLGSIAISLIATDLGYPVYKKAGFVEQTEYALFTKEPDTVPYSPSKNIIPYDGSYLEHVLRLDKLVSGEERSSILLEKIHTALLCKTNGRISGFYAPDLGEGLIIADNVDAGLELMHIRNFRSNRCILPINNRTGITFLQQNGYKETMRFRRMVLGTLFPWCPQGIYARIGGYVG